MPTFKITSKSVIMNASAMLNNLPTDGTMEVIIRPYVRKRRDEANNLYWVRLAEISEQAWLQGRQFPPDIWAEYLKAKFLPEVPTECETLDGYKKFAEMPDGTMKMVGSTTKLTTHGFANYLTQVEQFGAELGVRFSAQQN